MTEYDVPYPTLPYLPYPNYPTYPAYLPTYLSIEPNQPTEWSSCIFCQKIKKNEVIPLLYPNPYINTQTCLLVP